MIPLRDNLPTVRFPIVTVVLIAINVFVFLWQATLSSDDYSSPELRELGVPESDQATLELGAIPYRLLHPGDECAVGVVLSQGSDLLSLGRPETEVVCEGTREFAQAQALERRQGAPLVPLDAVPWWVTILTSMFLHAGLLHAAFNMLFLWVFGNNIEDSMGRPRFLLFYLLAGLVAVYAQSLLDPESTVPTIGASGAIAGVLGGYALLHPHARVLTLIFLVFFITFVEIPALIMLGIWLVLQFLPLIDQLGTDVSGEGGVAYLAHVGGFAFGLAAIKLFVRGRAPPRPAS